VVDNPDEGRPVAEIEWAGLAQTQSAGASDDELAIEARNNRRAFDLLYRRHCLGVFRFLRARTASDDEAAELAAVTFERALKAIGRYHPRGGGFPAWLFTIARNAALDAERTRRRHGSPATPATEPRTEPRDPTLTEDDFLRRERLAELRSRVSQLPDVQREAIVLRYAGGLSAREIAGTLGKSEAATQKILSRALAALRETYHEDA
jgi:RNA polymerase sigma factor (sigma-70 family)